MKKLLKNARIVNVFSGRLEEKNVLISEKKIVGVGDYQDDEADIVCDLEGKVLSPAFIDGHIHIESTTMMPKELAMAIVPHGTTAIVADPHEIANVCGVDGIKQMIESSEHLPITIFYMLPSCVPATGLDESGAVLYGDDLESLYSYEKVLGLAEMMNFPGVIYHDENVMNKIHGAYKRHKIIDGHAPLLRGKDLDKYISAGILSDHEVTNVEEAIEKIEKGQWIMIRQGTAAKNLKALLPLFDDENYSRRCLLVTDDLHPKSIVEDGHIDNIVRLAIKNGKSPIKAIQMATIQAATYFGLRSMGAIAPGYKADILVLDDLDSVKISEVYKNGNLVYSNGKMFLNSDMIPEVGIRKHILNSFCLDELKVDDFKIECKGSKCRVMEIVPEQIITNELHMDINFDVNNGIDVDRDILKIAVIERHKNTGHRGLGFVTGMKLKKGAMASSVAHDSHNLIVIGTNDNDMCIAANKLIEMGGGMIVVVDGEVKACLPLPVAGLMSLDNATTLARLNEDLLREARALGVPENIDPFMNMAFVSLPVIPSIKMSTLGFVDVNSQKLVSLFVE